MPPVRPSSLQHSSQTYRRGASRALRSNLPREGPTRHGRTRHMKRLQRGTDATLFRHLRGFSRGCPRYRHDLARGAPPVKAAKSVPVRFFRPPSCSETACRRGASSGPDWGVGPTRRLRLTPTRLGLAKPTSRERARGSLCALPAFGLLERILSAPPASGLLERILSALPASGLLERAGSPEGMGHTRRGRVAPRLCLLLPPSPKPSPRRGRTAGRRSAAILLQSKWAASRRPARGSHFKASYRRLSPVAQACGDRHRMPHPTAHALRRRRANWRPPRLVR